MMVKSKIITIKNRESNVVLLDYFADVKAGLSTGDNQEYLYKEADEIGPYRIVDPKKILTKNEIDEIIKNDKSRLKIINNGIPKNLFKGKTIVPYDKGGSSDIDEGRLSNYYSPTKFYIDWSEKNVKRMKTMTIAERKRVDGEKNIPKSDENKIAAVFRNTGYYFRPGITYSGVGLYVPTYRINSSTIFEHKAGSGIFIKKEFESLFSYKFLIGILCSKLIRYLQRNFINNTVNFQVEDVKKTPIALCDNILKIKIEKLVEAIINKQKKDPSYNYQNLEQMEIDKTVYEIYGFRQDLVKEIEEWYARRYPKLRVDET